MICSRILYFLTIFHLSLTDPSDAVRHKRQGGWPLLVGQGQGQTVGGRYPFDRQPFPPVGDQQMQFSLPNPRSSQSSFQFGNEIAGPQFWNNQHAGWQGANNVPIIRPANWQSTNANDWRMDIGQQQNGIENVLTTSNENGLKSANARSTLNDVLYNFVGGPVARKVNRYNTKQFVQQKNRFYWVGERFYLQDQEINLKTSTTCTFAVPQDINVLYETNDRVGQIVFQCAKFQESCCALDCCETENIKSYNLARSSNAEKRSINNLLILAISLMKILYIFYC